MAVWMNGQRQPIDTLGTGITSNYLFRVVDTDGTVVTEADSGVGIDGFGTTFGIASVQGDSQWYCGAGNEHVGMGNTDSVGDVNVEVSLEQLTGSQEDLWVRGPVKLEMIKEPM